MGPKTWLDIVKDTSIRLPDGGDTHLHPYPDGLTVTTRLPGGIEIHNDFDINGNPR